MLSNFIGAHEWIQFVLLVDFSSSSPSGVHAFSRFTQCLCLLVFGFSKRSFSVRLGHVFIYFDRDTSL